MTAEGVFRSSHPDVLAVWDARAEKVEARRVYALTLEERFGGRKALFTSRAVVGLQPLDGESGYRAPRSRDDLPGFRFGVKEGYWCPDKRTAEGRALAKEFAQYAVPKPRYPGMPGEVWPRSDDGGGSYLYTPGSQRFEDTIYVTWGCSAERLLPGNGDPREKGGDTVDLAVWEHVRLSEWHALLEARRDAEEAHA